MSGKRRAPCTRNFEAADAIRALREDYGLSREALAREVAELATKEDRREYTVSERTIARIESEGAVPTVRIKFAIASFFDVPVSEIWVPANRSALRVNG